MSNIPKLLDELSFLSRETKGASFVIQHSKESGKWKVVFNNAMCQLRNDPLRTETDFESAIQNGIDWLKQHRKSVDVIAEKFTLY